MTRFPRALLLALLLSITVPVHAAGLNDTGIDICYNDTAADGVAASDPASIARDAGTHPRQDCRYGQDAAAAAGVLPKTGAGAKGFDFTKIANNGATLTAGAALGAGGNDWACTRDNVTGLTWEVKTTGPAGLRSRHHKYTWFNTNGAENGGNVGSSAVVTYSSCDGSLPACNTQEFIAAVNASALCGYTDWRLPTPRELRGIVNYAVGLAGSFDTSYFTPAAKPSPHYFTGSTYAADAADVWLVEIGGEADGGGGGHHHGKGEEQHIVLVRGAQPDSPRESCAAANPKANVPESTPSTGFTDNGNGTVTHEKTGLMWKRCPEGLSGETCAAGAATTITWSSALAAAANSTFAGFTDWRLPNLKELHSIVETCGYDPSINQNIFPATPRPAFGSGFWSASTDAYRPTDAWLIVFDRGGGVASDKSSRLFVRLVRGGQSFDALLPALSEARNIDKFVTGGWGDPTQSGHGLSIEVLNDSLAVAFWYSHNPDGTSMFLVMVGTIQGNTMSGNANYFSGMVFGDFDPATLTEETWGTFSISFHDCNTATLTYSSTMLHKGVPFGSGTVNLKKLVSPPGLHCSDNPLAGTYHFTEASLEGIGIGAGIIFENGDLAFFAQNNTQAFVGLGNATQTGPNTFNADVARYNVSGGWDEITGTGTINENGVVANYNGTTLTATTIASFRHRLPLQQLAGNYVAYDLTNANVGTVVISSTGQVTGTLATGCNISGSVIVPNELFNQFYVLVNLTNCATPAEIVGGGIYDFDKDQIVAVASDGFIGYVWELRK